MTVATATTTGRGKLEYHEKHLSQKGTINDANEKDKLNTFQC